MPKYLLQVGYTPESWVTMNKNPQSRADMVRPAIEALGGKLEACYFALGEYDLVAIAEFPDNVAAAALGMAASASGSVDRYVTTALLTMEEGMAAMRAAGSSAYTPPR
jgi:uncharacterized protein with GYD domain